MASVHATGGVSPTRLGADDVTDAQPFDIARQVGIGRTSVRSDPRLAFVALRLAEFGWKPASQDLDLL